jgi:hypothetical protein
MTPCAEHRDTDFDREHDAHMYEIVYVIKRPGYEFVLSVPAAHTTDLTDASARFQLRFRGPHREREVVLDLKALEDFYESLSCLMDYVSIERQKSPQPWELRRLSTDPTYRRMK